MSVRILLLSLVAASCVKHADGFFTSRESEESARSLAEEDTFWEAVTEKVCRGEETQTTSCAPQLACNPCMPWDCTFGPWSEWSSPSALAPCSGLCERSRRVNQTGTECGLHCKGITSQTKVCSEPSCIASNADCNMSVWSAWSTCASSREQSTRTRQVHGEADHRGAACSGSLVETKACSLYQPRNCTFSAWSGWGDCSTTCGGGSATRIRHVQTHADRHGTPCAGPLSQETACGAGRCPDYKDCALGAWASWSSCHFAASERDKPLSESPSYGQRTRSRNVTAGAQGGGKGCASATRETEGCYEYLKLPMDCVLSPWAVWSSCTQECGGGQKNRSRTVVSPALNGGSCPGGIIREVAGCNTQRCSHTDCRLGQWESWTKCPVTCGTGFVSRFRAVTEASPGGRPCRAGSLTEVKPCDIAACAKKDCVWTSWSLWTDCTRTCGGGTTERFRNLTSLPHNGGTCQPELGRVTAACNTHPCGKKCVNGAWGQWSKWTSCTATCGRGYMMRYREMAVAPNDCGLPALGIADEYASCSQFSKKCNVVPDLDCKLSEWTPWSDCSGSCSGINSRQRSVKVYAHGHGASCAEAPLKQIKQCSKNSTFACSGEHRHTPIDCNMTEWTNFAPCSVSCGGGTIVRTRSFSPAREGGSACQGALSKVEACGTQLCPSSQCVDCRWGKWSEWDACVSHEGQRSRRREIQQIGNYCGKRCEETAAAETRSCRGAVAGPAYLFCTWAPWSTYSACPLDRCGANQITRQRSLVTLTGRNASYLVRAQLGEQLTCSGRQEDLSFCNNTPCATCQPRNCTLSTWAAWEPGGDTGLCRRTRHVASFNNECGTGCGGTLVETKPCPVSRMPVDCTFGEWNMWTQCARSEGQRERTRHIEKAPANGGKACIGELKQTKPCDPAWLPPQDCSTSAWSRWSKCTAPCNGGSQERVRNVIAAARWPGKLCDLALQQLRDCNTGPCFQGAKQDCEFTDWGQWSSTCSGQNQRFRDRQIKSAPSGAACGGAVQQTQACASSVVDCKIAGWTPWSGCDTTCGVGRRERTRQIHEYPSVGGMPCPVDLVELGRCNENHPCDLEQDCQVSSWRPWTPCTASCGAGQSMRSRLVTKERSLGGVGCHMAMSETRSCGGKTSCITQCLWGQWSSWGSCSRTCGGGMKTRSRRILQSPTAGAETCDAKSEEEVAKCNSGTCKLCADGTWTTWAEWTSCSATCGDGFTWRLRKVAKEASKCGVPAYGPSREVKACEGGQGPCVFPSDCEFSTWGQWGACSATADGLHERERFIARYSTDNGAQCNGALKQVSQCLVTTASGIAAIAPTAPLPCAFSDWTPFSNCSVSCGGGHQSRTRRVTHQYKCQGPVNETRACNTQLCHAPVDCAWHDWSEWGRCDVCSGVRHRNRQLITQGSRGGKLCDSGDAQEVGKCPRDCHGKYLCAWAGWSAWSVCSKTCGSNGERTRTRELRPVNSSSGSEGQKWNTNDLEDKVAELFRQNQHVDAQRVQHLALAFMAGVVTLVVVFALVRPRDGLTRSNRELQIYCVEDRRLVFL